MQSNPVGWFEVYVQDMPRAKAFYEAVFQLTLTELKTPDLEGIPDIEMWAFPMDMDGAGASGALVRMPGYASGGGTMVYFTCDDCAVEAARAASSGGAVVQQKMSLGEYGYAAMVSDTEGNVIGLHSLQ
jgi:uncharacterized protein